MKIPNRLLAPLVLALPVLAQAVEPERPAIGEPVPSQQRRADLRSALKAQSQSQSQTETQTQTQTQAAVTREGRHRLSPQERAELREQLRQQQSVSRPRS